MCINFTDREIFYSFMLFMNTDNFQRPERFASYFVCLVLMKKKIIFLSNFRVYVCRRCILGVVQELCAFMRNTKKLK